MQRNAHLILDRVSRAIESVLKSDGVIDGKETFTPEHLQKIAESMARKVSEPTRYVCQGFHNTAFQQGKLRQYLDSRPDVVMEMIALLVNRGQVNINIAGSKEKITVIADLSSLLPDLESRLASDHLVWTNGIRDYCGQLWDILLSQLYWSRKTKGTVKYIYSQEPDPKAGSSGEKLSKVESTTGNRFEVIYPGAMLTLRAAVELSLILDGNADDFLIHQSIASEPNGKALPAKIIDGPEQLRNWFRTHNAKNNHPALAAVFAGKLPGANGISSGHDLHIVTVQSDPEVEYYFLESRWGMNHDLHLNGIDAEELIDCMRLPTRDSELPKQPYDNLPPTRRVINPSYPIKKSDRPHQFQLMELQAMRFLHAERNARRNAKRGKADSQEDLYLEKLIIWESQRREHIEIFGETIPFPSPAPEQPLSQEE